MKTNDKTETVIINAKQLAVIISDEIGRPLESKRLRSVLRSDSELSEFFDDGKYTSYRFNHPSKMTDKIITRFVEIEKTNAESKSKSAERRTERKNKSQSVLDLDKKGKVISKRIKSDGTEITPVTEKTESK